jgi:hypothetical protein
MVRTPFTPFALKPRYHVLFVALCCALFVGMYLFDRPVRWTYWAGGLFLGALGGLMQIWSVKEVIHSRKGRVSWKEFTHLVTHTRWGKGYLVYGLSYFFLVLYLGRSDPANMLENAIADYLSFITAKEMVTLGERYRLQDAYSFKEKRFEWLKLRRFRETPLRRFIRRWFHFV